jgi:hypothetical protein
MAIREVITLEGVEQVEAALNLDWLKDLLHVFRLEKFLNPTDSLEPVADRVGGWRNDCRRLGCNRQFAILPSAWC